MPECAKTHLQQSAISKILRGRNPRTPASKGRPRITRQGRERLTRGGQGKGSGGVILTDWAKLDITVCTYTMHTFYKKYHATSSKSDVDIFFDWWRVCTRLYYVTTFATCRFSNYRIVTSSSHPCLSRLKKILHWSPLLISLQHEFLTYINSLW